MVSQSLQSGRLFWGYGITLLHVFSLDVSQRRIDFPRVHINTLGFKFILENDGPSLCLLLVKLPQSLLSQLIRTPNISMLVFFASLSHCRKI